MRECSACSLAVQKSQANRNGPRIFAGLGSSLAVQKSQANRNRNDCVFHEFRDSDSGKSRTPISVNTGQCFR